MSEQLRGLLEDLEEFALSFIGEGASELESNPNLKTCWIRHECNRKRCPGYGREGLRCWHLLSSECFYSSRPLSLREKWRHCRQCPLFLEATPDDSSRLLEFRNNLVFLFKRMSAYGIASAAGKVHLAGVPTANELSRRETDVMLLLLDRHTHPEIATILEISVDTVKSHVKAIHRKMGVHSKKELRTLVEGMRAPATCQDPPRTLQEAPPRLPGPPCRQDPPASEGLP
jgi:DNA-binding CsgD family transcriptional regulator